MRPAKPRVRAGGGVEVIFLRSENMVTGLDRTAGVRWRVLAGCVLVLVSTGLPWYAVQGRGVSNLLARAPCAQQLSFHGSMSGSLK